MAGQGRGLGRLVNALRTSVEFWQHLRGRGGGGGGRGRRMGAWLDAFVIEALSISKANTQLQHQK